MHQFIADYLSKFIHIPFAVDMNGKHLHVGEGKPEFTVTIHQELSKKDLLTSTTLALGEAYMNGVIEVDRDLYEVLDLFLGNMESFHREKADGKKMYHLNQTKKHQKEEVTSHYDIGNDFYEKWLDESMSYSCAYFKNNTDTLYEAQCNKVHHILDKLQLKEGMTLLDIGCGWGFLLKIAVKEYGVKGVGITLSKEQYRKCQADIKNEGLQEQLSVELMDYRDLKKSGYEFDRVVSVGMIEHVGRGQYEEFLSCADAVMKPGALFLLHYISGHKEHWGDPWIKKYIFPGGMLPSLREIIYLLPTYHFYTLDVESLRRHYNKTLLCWRKNYLEHACEIRKEKGEAFFRMWDAYLASCAAAFQNGVIDLHQILMSKGINNDLPMNRVI
ncbi:class I SAM-dependent methyltransferase [Anaerosporobacter faecicola]|uniref:class I SAM-dependent methyltransferase n=1 Tax=Anaerosporobacter faecicola TaxID=2718714 RepID=UPI001439D1E9|nr:cyclopropane-fatty-acyl-phospholipid synthase family protein [Anaerosporobacter faecicola]